MDYPFGFQGAPVDDTLLPTPSCIAGQEPTEAATAGPFYTPLTPRRRNFLEDAQTGTGSVRIIGRIMTTSCVPVAGAILDAWHCDDAGVYDNTGFLFRGHQYTDADGVFELTTIKPAPYTDGVYRAPHVHVKLQGPGTDLLTTQLFFSEDTDTHERDGLFDPRLLTAHVGDVDGVRVVYFDFVLPDAP